MVEYFHYFLVLFDEHKRPWLCQPPFDAVPEKLSAKRIMDIPAAVNDNALFPLNELEIVSKGIL